MIFIFFSGTEFSKENLILFAASFAFRQENFSPKERSRYPSVGEGDMVPVVDFGFMRNFTLKVQSPSYLPETAGSMRSDIEMVPNLSCRVCATKKNNFWQGAFLEYSAVLFCLLCFQITRKQFGVMCVR